jgi:hypothetical protein
MSYKMSRKLFLEVFHRKVTIRPRPLPIYLLYLLIFRGNKAAGLVITHRELITINNGSAKNSHIQCIQCT